MIITFADKKNVTWYMHSTDNTKNGRRLYFMKRKMEGALDVDVKWLNKYEIINGTNCPIIRKRRR